GVCERDSPRSSLSVCGVVCVTVCVCVCVSLGGGGCRRTFLQPCPSRRRLGLTGDIPAALSFCLLSLSLSLSLFLLLLLCLSVSLSQVLLPQSSNSSSNTY